MVKEELEIRFNEKDRPEFYKELRKRVKKYFKENEISKHANLQMVLKSIFMLTLYFAPFIVMVTGVVSSSWGILLLWVIMGVGFAGIGLSIMHDANHGAYSSNDRVNRLMGFTLNFLGGYHENWKIQHNVLHHSYTNIDGFDEDIEKEGILRLSPNRNKKWIYKFQVFYAPFLYAALTLHWSFVKDFEQVVKYNEKKLLRVINTTFAKALFQIILYKMILFALIIGLPVYIADISWGLTIGGFFLMHAIAGLILSLVFVPAHICPKTQYFSPEQFNESDNSWAIHQLKTSCNFATSNSLLTWYVGGLNYQIEHHLFPTICHVHYPAISKIVQATAKEYNVSYLEYRTFLGAISDHLRFLNDLGKGKV